MRRFRGAFGAACWFWAALVMHYDGSGWLIATLLPVGYFCMATARPR